MNRAAALVLLAFGAPIAGLVIGPMPVRVVAALALGVLVVGLGVSALRRASKQVDRALDEELNPKDPQ